MEVRKLVSYCSQTSRAKFKIEFSHVYNLIWLTEETHPWARVFDDQGYVLLEPIVLRNHSAIKLLNHCSSTNSFICLSYFFVLNSFPKEKSMLKFVSAPTRITIAMFLRPRKMRHSVNPKSSGF